MIKLPHSIAIVYAKNSKKGAYCGNVYDIPQGGRAARGRAIVNLIGCEPSEKVEAFVSVKEF